MKRPQFSRPTLVALSLALAGCGSSAAGQAEPAASPQVNTTTQGAGSLNRFAAERVMVMPLQGVLSADPLGWRPRAGEEKTLLQRADSAFGAQLTDRGLASWVQVSALVRAARRNPTYLTDPYQVRAAGPIRVALRSKDQAILEPLSSQLRSLAGVTDARWALIPTELAFVPADSGGRVQLALAIVDVRRAQVVWAGQVRGDASGDYTFAAVVSALQRAADLIVPQ